MEEIIAFLHQNIFLVGLLIVVLLVFVANEVRLYKTTDVCVDVQKAINMINQQAALVVDIRKPDVYKDGHLANSINCPEFNSAHPAIKKGKPIIVVCYRGVSSIAVAKECRAAGLDAYSLKGGCSALINENVPLVRG